MLAINTGALRRHIRRWQRRPGIQENRFSEGIIPRHPPARRRPVSLKAVPWAFKMRNGRRFFVHVQWSMETAVPLCYAVLWRERNAFEIRYACCIYFVVNRRNHPPQRSPLPRVSRRCCPISSCGERLVPSSRSSLRFRNDTVSEAFCEW